MSIISRNSNINIKDIDKSCKNKFRWDWLEEKDDNGDYLSTYIRKLDIPGKVKCDLCKVDITYASTGKSDLKSHARKKDHVSRRNSVKDTHSLPAVFNQTNSIISGMCRWVLEM